MAASSSLVISVCALVSLFSDSGVPEHRGRLSGCSGWGRIWRRLLPLPAGQNGHTVLLVQILLGPLTGFDLPTQNPFLLNHLHHGGISTEPRHLETTQTSASATLSLQLRVCSGVAPLWWFCICIWCFASIFAGLRTLSRGVAFLCSSFALIFFLHLSYEVLPPFWEVLHIIWKSWMFLLSFCMFLWVFVFLHPF